MNNEWGGYLPLEYTIKCNYKNVLFKTVDNRNIVRLNSARNAVCFLMELGRYNKIWIPLYMCLSIKESLENYRIHFEYYSIDEEFFPNVESIPVGDVILICNYFGLKGKDFYKKCMNRFSNIIFDNTQALFCEPIMGNNIFNIYSPRKFVGVSDGAFLVGSDLDVENGVVSKEIEKLSIDTSFERGNYLLKSSEISTNEAYDDYLKSEEKLGKEIRIMSRMTECLLGGIDYTRIESIRKNNYQKLKSKLDRYNELDLKECDRGPMCYPLLRSDDMLRKRLVDNNIYVPQWWKWIIGEKRANNWEVKVSKWLYPIPIDQRYTEDEMDELAERIIDLL